MFVGQLIIAGIVSGAIYALIAVGLVVIYKASHVLNFAHGHVSAVAAFVAFSLLVDKEMAIPIAIIVNELVTNALKHAFDGREEGDVVVTGRLNGELRLTVADNGVGIGRSAKADRGGLGSKLVENFARQLGARHEIVSSEQGTTHDLVIPKVA